MMSEDTPALRRQLVLGSALVLAGLPAWAQGMCSGPGITLDEVLAAWENAKTKTQMDKDAFNVLVQRKSKALFKGLRGGVETEEMGVIGEMSVNGKAIGAVVENDAMRVKAGSYRGIVRYVNKKKFVQGPLGEMAEVGDFLLEVTGVIVVSTMVAAPVQDVWHAYTSPEDIKDWNTASPDWHTTSASVDLRPGGKFSSRMEAKDGSFGFDFAGEYTRIVPLQAIEYMFGDRVGLVEFAESTGGVTVTVTFDSEDTHSEEQQRTGWQAILDSFSKHVEGKLASQ